MTYFLHGLGSTPAAATAAADDAAAKIATFARLVGEEAERCFQATFLKRDSDRALADDVKVTAARASTDAKTKASGTYAFLRDPAKAKSTLDAAMNKAATVLPQIKDVAKLDPLRTALVAAKSAIDAAVAAAKAAASARPPSSASSGASLLPPGLIPPADTGAGAGGGFSVPPLGVFLLVTAAALFLIPSKKRSNPSSIVKTRGDEKLWRRAKAAARRQGRSDYRYIVGTFKRMQANKALSRL